MIVGRMNRTGFSPTVKTRTSPRRLIPCLPLLSGGLVEGEGLIQGRGGIHVGIFFQILALFEGVLFYKKNIFRAKLA